MLLLDEQGGLSMYKKVENGKYTEEISQAWIHRTSSALARLYISIRALDFKKKARLR